MGLPASCSAMLVVYYTSCKKCSGKEICLHKAYVCHTDEEQYAVYPAYVTYLRKPMAAFPGVLPLLENVSIPYEDTDGQRMHMNKDNQPVAAHKVLENEDAKIWLNSI